MSWRILQGHVLDRLAELPDESVQCCITSPPYFGLRDYGTAEWEGGDPTCTHRNGNARQDHSRGVRSGSRGEQKAAAASATPMRNVCTLCGAERIDQQIGLEPTLSEFIDKLVAVFAEVRRVLKPDGTLWVNIGDSYASKPRGSDNGWDKSRLSNPARVQKAQSASLRRGRRTRGEGAKEKDLLMVPAILALALREDGWWLRSEVIWHKLTPMPESVTDRPSRAHEQLYLLAKSKRYYYDADAVREPLAPKTLTTFGTQRQQQGGGDLVKADNWARDVPDRKPKVDAAGEPVGANKRDVWSLSSSPYPEAHFATYPPKLIEPCILAGTKPGDVVLDPFAGSGTTLMVAERLGRDSVGIELNPEYVALARRRIVDDCPLHNTAAEVAA